MPDRHLPRRWQVLLRVIRAAVYLLLAGAGFFVLFSTPKTIVGRLGEPLTHWWAILLLVGAAVALLGVILDRFRIEWAALWPALGGGLIYTSTVWNLWLHDEPGRGTQSMVVAALTGFVAYRLVELAAHAAVLREAHARKLRARRRLGPRQGSNDVGA